MVLLQLETGMSPARWRMRPCRHRHGARYGCTVSAHKTCTTAMSAGGDRPKGQEIIRPISWLTRKPTCSPARNMEGRATTMRATARPGTTSQKPEESQAEKKPGNVYTVTNYARGIAEAIKRHNRGRPRANISHIGTRTNCVTREPMS